MREQDGETARMTTIPVHPASACAEDARGLLRSTCSPGDLRGLVSEHFFGDAARQAQAQAVDRAARTRPYANDPGGRGGRASWVRGAWPPRGTGPARERELRVLCVLREHHGGGAGQALLTPFLARSRAGLVAEANPRAIRFYERNGFRADGATPHGSCCGGPPRDPHGALRPAPGEAGPDSRTL
ncbi:GNAT family N-acetyltransferase [Kocuria rhizophila]|nr:GNAT family N-acetyltransferase [Kocuria rhizophila]